MYSLNIWIEFKNIYEVAKHQRSKKTIYKLHGSLLTNESGDIVLWRDAWWKKNVIPYVNIIVSKK